MTASSIHRARRRATALVAALAVCSTLAACGADASSKAPEKPILTEKSLAKVWKDYDRLNNAAMVKAGPPAYDGMAYAVVDTGAILDYDLTDAKVNRIDRAKRSKPFHNVPKSLYAPVESAGFAMDTTNASDDKPGANPSLDGLVRVGDPATWKQEISVEVRRPKDLPDPLEPGRASTASKSDIERARTVVTRISEYWQTLRKPSGIVLGDAPYADFAKSHRAALRSKYDVKSKLVMEGIPQTPGAGEALRVVRAKGGLLVLVTVRVRGILVTHQKGTTITLSGVPGKLFGTEPKKASRLHSTSSLAISIPDKGSAVVLGLNSTPLLK